MWNPGNATTNRKARRFAAKWNGDKWKPGYNLANTPIDLGIKEMKRKFPGEYDHIRFYKESMWQAHKELHG